MRDTLRRLFQHKAWADDALLEALAGLGDGHPVTLLAIKALSHSYIVDRIFAAHLRQEGHGYPSANAVEMPPLAELAEQLRTSDRDYVDYVSALPSARLGEWIDFVFTDGKPGRMSREEMLLHVITHGIGHRGQISAVILLNSIAPAKDGLTTYLHQAEAGARRRAAA